MVGNLKPYIEHGWNSKKVELVGNTIHYTEYDRKPNTLY